MAQYVAENLHSYWCLTELSTTEKKIPHRYYQHSSRYVDIQYFFLYYLMTFEISLYSVKGRRLNKYGVLKE